MKKRIIECLSLTLISILSLSLKINDKDSNNINRYNLNNYSNIEYIEEIKNPNINSNKELFELMGLNNELLNNYQGNNKLVAVIDDAFNINDSLFNELDTNSNNNIKYDKNKILELFNDDEEYYYNSKIPFIYDYSDKDFDLTSSLANNGTSIISLLGSNSNSFKGLLPFSQLALLKVGKENNNNESLIIDEISIINALNDLLKLDVDSINFSFDPFDYLDINDKNVIDLFNKFNEKNIPINISLDNSNISNVDNNNNDSLLNEYKIPLSLDDSFVSYSNLNLNNINYIQGYSLNNDSLINKGLYDLNNNPLIKYTVINDELVINNYENKFYKARSNIFNSTLFTGISLIFNEYLNDSLNINEEEDNINDINIIDSNNQLYTSLIDINESSNDHKNNKYYLPKEVGKGLIDLTKSINDAYYSLNINKSLLNGSFSKDNDNKYSYNLNFNISNKLLDTNLELVPSLKLYKPLTNKESINNNDYYYFNDEHQYQYELIKEYTFNDTKISLNELNEYEYSFNEELILDELDIINQLNEEFKYGLNLEGYLELNNSDLNINIPLSIYFPSNDNQELTVVESIFDSYHSSLLENKINELFDYEINKDSFKSMILSSDQGIEDLLEEYDFYFNEIKNNNFDYDTYFDQIDQNNIKEIDSNHYEIRFNKDEVPKILFNQFYLNKDIKNVDISFDDNTDFTFYQFSAENTLYSSFKTILEEELIENNIFANKLYSLTPLIDVNNINYDDFNVSYLESGKHELIFDFTLKDNSHEEVIFDIVINDETNNVESINNIKFNNDDNLIEIATNNVIEEVLLEIDEKIINLSDLNSFNLIDDSNISFDPKEILDNIDIIYKNKIIIKYQDGSSLTGIFDANFNHLLISDESTFNNASLLKVESIKQNKLLTNKLYLVDINDIKIGISDDAYLFINFTNYDYGYLKINNITNTGFELDINNLDSLYLKAETLSGGVSYSLSAFKINNNPSSSSIDIMPIIIIGVSIFAILSIGLSIYYVIKHARNQK